jgi:hypothetical protein
MIDCDLEIRKFHDDKVTLKKEDQDTLRGNRDANQSRLKDRLDKNKDPLPKKFVKQGSYAMRTMIQNKKNDYDIDDGALFDRAELKDKAPLDARKMVCTALQDSRFKRQPEVLKNCIRVYYDEGHHVDIPVYRNTESDKGYELASSEWKESDPEGVNSWFKDCKKRQIDEGEQFVRLVRLLKAFSRSRESWKSPSGFAITVLANECIKSVFSKEDEALRSAMKNICDRLKSNLEVQHPVVSESLSTGKETKFSNLLNYLTDALSDLEVLDNLSCSKLNALKAWKSVLNTDFFDEQIAVESEKKSLNSIQVMSSNPSTPFEKDGDRRFGKDQG